MLHAKEEQPIIRQAPAVLLNKVMRTSWKGYTALCVIISIQEKRGVAILGLGDQISHSGLTGADFRFCKGARPIILGVFGLPISIYHGRH